MSHPLRFLNRFTSSACQFRRRVDDGCDVIIVGRYNKRVAMGSIRSVFTWVLLGVLVALLSPIGSADAPKQDSLTAKQILDRMAEAYAGCKSYRDSGIVKTVFVRASGDDTKENTFATAFVRPDRFRFGCKRLTDRLNREQRYIVWCKGKEVQTWWNIKSDIEQQPSLGKALVGATGVSGGSAHTVPALLFPEEIGGRRLTDLKDAKRVDDAKLDDVACFRIQGSYGSQPITLWLEKKTFLVRKIDSQAELADRRVETTTTYDPIIDGEIPDEVLEFNPPKEK